MKTPAHHLRTFLDKRIAARQKALSGFQQEIKVYDRRLKLIIDLTHTPRSTPSERLKTATIFTDAKFNDIQKKVRAEINAKNAQENLDRLKMFRRLLGKNK